MTVIPEEEIGLLSHSPSAIKLRRYLIKGLFVLRSSYGFRTFSMERCPKCLILAHLALRRYTGDYSSIAQAGDEIESNQRIMS